MPEIIATPSIVLVGGATVELAAVPTVEVVSEADSSGLAAPAAEAVLPLPKITDAMCEAAPDDPSLRPGYFLGALAAVVRRACPIVTPQAWDVAPQGQPHWDPQDTVTEEYLPFLASPIVELVREEMPDLVMAADRGGRMLGLAVHAIWRRRYPGAPFPTIDSAVHFGRVSSSLGYDVTSQIVRGVLHRSGVMAEMAQRKAEGDTRPLTVMLLDDWVSGGSTAYTVKNILEDHGLIKGKNLRYLMGTMTGNHLSVLDDSLVDRHVVGDLMRRGGASWTDNEEMIGVTYLLKQERGRRAKKLRPVGAAVPSVEARIFRQQLHQAVTQDIEPSPHPYPTNRVRFAPVVQKRPSRPVRLIRNAFRRLVNTVF